MKFVYYRTLASCFDVSIETLNDDNRNQLKEKAENHFKSNNSLKCDDQTFSMTEVFTLIDGLKNSSTVVFHDWIKSDAKISTVIQGNIENLDFQDKVSNIKYKGHALEMQFYSFLTPFLFPLLEKEIFESVEKKDFESLRFFLQYSNFVEESKKLLLQQEVDRQLRKLFSDIVSDFSEDEIREETAEIWKDNSKEVECLTSPELVGALNLLDKQFYALRLSYIDAAKVLMTSRKIEPITFKMLSRVISNVELNSSHKSQVESFLQKGKSKIYQQQRTTVFNKALLRNPLTYLGFLVLIILILFIFPFDFKNNKLTKNQKITGLDSLSQDEVKQTDSLLAYNEDSILFDTDDMSVPQAMPDFILSDNSSEIKNTTVVKLYESMLSDYEIQQNNGGTDCDPLEGSALKEFNYEGIDDIQTQFSNHKFINKSNQDCYFMIFDNKKEGILFGKLVPAGSSIELKIVKNWRVIFYTGSELTKFHPLKTSNNGYGNLEDAKKIHKSFNTHFCKMNYSNLRLLSKIYHVTSLEETTRLINNLNGALEIQSESIQGTK